MMPVVDEYSRECLALEVERSITSEEVVKTLDRLFAERGAPRFIRSDNGPEFIAQAVKRWLAASGVETLYIESTEPRGRMPTQKPSSAACETSYSTGKSLPI